MHFYLTVYILTFHVIYSCQYSTQGGGFWAGTKTKSHRYLPFTVRAVSTLDPYYPATRYSFIEGGGDKNSGLTTVERAMGFRHWEGMLININFVFLFFLML